LGDLTNPARIFSVLLLHGRQKASEVGLDGGRKQGDAVLVS
jgi:hypothetical protein